MAAVAAGARRLRRAALGPPDSSGTPVAETQSAMESKAKLLGHPIHPMLVVFPLGLFVSGTVMDLLARYLRRKDLAAAGYWSVLGGLIGGLAAAVFGLVDWLAIPWGTRAKNIGLWHAGGNLVVTGLFAMSWLRRQGRPEVLPDDASLGAEVVATVIGGVSGWLGGELVDRLGVGVDHGAHLDAPSSLTGPVPPREPSHSTGIEDSRTDHGPLQRRAAGPDSAPTESVSTAAGG